MKKTLTAILASVAFAVSSVMALAADIKPALIYDVGGKFDKSFNESAYRGAEKFTKDMGIEVREFEVTNEAQREQALRKFARSGQNPIAVTGFAWGSALEKAAKEFPDTKFVIIDGVVDMPNVRSVIFKEQEGSYLVGVLAALASKSDKVGFVGGMDIPLIHKFLCGYKAGVKSVKGDVEIFEAMTGTTGAAWNDPVKGGEIATSQINQGADVVYHAAGSTGTGVLEAAAAAGKLGIGVDSNQNHLHPGKVLTSMVKRVDVAIYKAYQDFKDGKFTAGIQSIGAKEGGVDFALDEHNKPLINDDMLATVNKAKQDIIDGKLEVHDYMSDEKCPY